MTAQLASLPADDAPAIVAQPLPPLGPGRPANRIDDLVRRVNRAASSLLASPRTPVPPLAPPLLLDQVRRVLRDRHYSPRTESAFIEWIHRFFAYFPGRTPESFGELELKSYLDDLARRCDVTPAARGQARAALLVLFHGVLGKRVSCAVELGRPAASKGAVALTRAEIRALLAAMEPALGLAAALMYGSGLRPAELLALRVRDLDFAAGVIHIRGGRERGRKEPRCALLPAALVDPLRAQLERNRALFAQDARRRIAVGNVPEAVRSEDAAARWSWDWQWLFPAGRAERDPLSGEGRRPHQHEALLQRALTCAARAAGVSHPINTHTLRHCFMVHMLDSGIDPALVQALLGIAGPCPLAQPARWPASEAVRSPLDA